MRAFAIALLAALGPLEVHAQDVDWADNTSDFVVVNEVEAPERPDHTATGARLDAILRATPRASPSPQIEETNPALGGLPIDSWELPAPPEPASEPMHFGGDFGGILVDELPTSPRPAVHDRTSFYENDTSGLPLMTMEDLQVNSDPNLLPMMLASAMLAILGVVGASEPRWRFLLGLAGTICIAMAMERGFYWNIFARGSGFSDYEPSFWTLNRASALLIFLCLLVGPSVYRKFKDTAAPPR